MPFLIVGEALVDPVREPSLASYGELPLRARDRAPREALGPAAEAGARATESWGAVA